MSDGFTCVGPDLMHQAWAMNCLVPLNSDHSTLVQLVTNITQVS